ncbi:HNH endonuclease signature motif containing protein [Clostridium botulinum]|uniref:HNH endonuclease signature motif containing protein n=1 Tax=Clostridium botulinum TaxID=1491 RepID=UPI001968218A|nr:HNH endonuclease signature motif containing protein [Clostridium botulinum]
MGRKEIKASIIKELYAKSGNICAFPGCKNRLFSDDKNGKNHISNICHIQGYNKGSARYNPNLSEDEANDISNLILLCKNHHGYIDQNEEIYMVEFLKSLKKSHETDIEALFSEKVLNTGIIKDIEKINCNKLIKHINENSDYELDKKYVIKLLKKIVRQKKVTRKILFKVIEYYYDNDNIDMICICNETNLNENEFYQQLRILVKNEFIDEIEFDDSIRSFIEDNEGNVRIVSEDYLYKMNNGTWQLEKSGEILIEILKYLSNSEEFYDLLVKSKFKCIKDK